jgi:2-methylisocitrate lyase-like PEP mutase family enzyme
MPTPRPNQLSAIDTFRTLHESGCFVLPNPFDVGSAVYLHHLGFKALATSSAGFAFTRGLPDDVSAIPRDLMLKHIRDVVEATPLPVNADFQNGYANEPDHVATNVSLCIATGVAGLSIEDATGDRARPLYEEALAVERVRAARRAIDDSGLSVILTARCEAWLAKDSNAFEVALKRLVAFAEAGADCLYAPGVTDPKQIAAIVSAVSPKPVNVLVFGSDTTLTVSKLADLGVRRISVGSWLARVAWGAFIRAAENIATTGSFELLTAEASSADLNGLFRNRA